MIRKTLVAVLAGALALGAAACGSNDKSSSDTAGTGKPVPEAKQSITAVLPGFNKAIASQTCEAYAPFALTFTRPVAAKPGDPAIVKDECPNYRALLARNLKGVRFTEAKEYGTAAIAQGPGPRLGKWTNHSAVFILDWDGRYRFYLTNAGDKQIGTHPKAGVDYQQTIDTYLRAIRDRDCAAFQRVSYPNAGPNLGLKPAEACKQVFAGKNLAPQLRADPGARAVKLGETLDWGFFGVATKRNYYTFIVTTRPNDAGAEWKGKGKTVVIDYFPNYEPVA